MSIPPAATPARRGLFLMYAEAKRPNDAYHWFEELRREGGVDLTSLAVNSEVVSLRGDSRFANLFPDKIAFHPPFVEKVKVIHEWRGEAAGDEFGWIGRPLGDVDGDRVNDVVISATANPPHGVQTGKVYVYSGKTGALLWNKEGEKNALLGTGLEAAGDVNGDGIPDVVAGAPGIGTVLVFGGKDGRELLRLQGDSADSDLGAAAAGIGDFNKDGHGDIIAGSPSSRAHAPGAGRVFIFSGKDGARLLTLDGAAEGDGFGSSVGGGYGRFFIVGAGTAGPAKHGRVYVYDRLTREPLFVKEPGETGTALGNMFVSVVGDVNGDQVPDIYTTDFLDGAKGPNTGRAYVYSGRGGDKLIDLEGERAGEGFGAGPGRTGDVDGDGLADLVVGSWQFSDAAWSGGRVRVLSGKDGRTLQSYTGRVPGETLGFDAVGVGDIDGDGSIDYLLTSAWSMVNGIRSGRAYIVSGTVAPRSGQ